MKEEVEGAPAAVSQSDEGGADPKILRLFRYAPLLIALPVVVGILILVFGRQADRRNSPPLPVYVALPDVELVAQDGNPFAISGLRGHVFIANFIFTRCASSCPRMSSKLARIQERLSGQGSKIRLVSFSVDPTHDDPAALAIYARGYGARPEVWTFLTGPTESVQKAVVDGFKLPMGKPERDAKASVMEPLSILHSEKFVLVDASGSIRGYYDSDDAGVEKVLADAQSLVERGGA